MNTMATDVPSDRTGACPTRDELAALSRGLLPEESLETIAAHVSDCTRCGEVLASIEDAGDPFLSAVRRPPGTNPCLADAGCRSAISRAERIVCDLPPAAGGGSRYEDPGQPVPIPEVPGYEVLGQVGRGGMGVVYLARQVSLGRRVALKVLGRSRQADPEFRRRFQREAETVAHLQHPNIVQIHEIAEHEGFHFLALEFIEGGSLSDRLRESPLPPDEAAHLVETLARAMQSAHEAGVVHRDLKPSNVLLASDGTPKITDFGLAKRLETAGETQTGEVLGTPGYMPPEQALGSSGWSQPAVDVYALGAVLYESITGRPPFRADSPYQTIRLVIDEDPLAPSRLQPKTPRDLETICLKCLDKQPERRYASCVDLAEDLRRFQAGEPIRARPISLGRRLVKWARRRPAVASLLVATLVATVALVAVWIKFTADVREQRDVAKHMSGVAQQKQKEAEDQRQIAIRKQGEAEDNFREAELQKGRAIKSLERVREAAEEYYALVAHDGDLRAQGLEPLRQRLIEKTAGLYDAVVDDYAEIPELRAEQARAYWMLGQRTADLATPAEAVGPLRKAIEISKQLVERSPDDYLYRYQLGIYQNDLAYGLNSHGQLEEAEAVFRQAIAAFDEALPLAADTYERKQALFNQARTRQCLSRLLRNGNRLDEAEQELLQGREAIEEAIGEDGLKASTGYLDTLALISNSLGVVYEYSDRPEEAETAYRRSIELREELMQRFPNDPVYREGVTAPYNNLGRLLTSDAERAVEAVDLITKSVDHLSKLAADHPQVPRYRSNMLLVLGTLAKFHENNDRRTEAAAVYRQSADLRFAMADESPDDWRAVAGLAFCLLSLAKMTDAADADESLDRLARGIELLGPWLENEAQRDGASGMLQGLHNVRGDLLRAAGREEEAAGEFQRAEDLKASKSGAEPG